MNIITLHEASVILGLPEFLIRDFVSYEFNGKKLSQVSKNSSDYEFELQEVRAFQRHLELSWPGTDRRDPPEYVKRYLIYEAQGVCALCRQPKPNYEYAHIRPWASSRCNSPHNTLHFCLDCHQSYGKDEKLLRGVKEECLRRIQLVDFSLLYECTPDIVPGEAVYVLEGHVYRAHSKSSADYLASSFVQTKVGIDRCTVQRTGVVLSIGGLEPGMDYLLSPLEPGKVVTRSIFDKSRDISKEALIQFVGRAESCTHLAIGSLGINITIDPGTSMAL